MNIKNRFIIGGLLALSMILPASSALAVQFDEAWYKKANPEECTYNPKPGELADPVRIACVARNRTKCLAYNVAVPPSQLSRCPGSPSYSPNPATKPKPTVIVSLNASVVADGIKLAWALPRVQVTNGSHTIIRHIMALKSDATGKSYYEFSGRGSITLKDPNDAASDLFLAKNQISYVDKAIEAGVPYVYELRTYLGDGKSELSNYSSNINDPAPAYPVIFPLPDPTKAQIDANNIIIAAKREADRVKAAAKLADARLIAEQLIAAAKLTADAKLAEAAKVAAAKIKADAEKAAAEIANAPVPAVRGGSLPPRPGLRGGSLPPSPALQGDSLPPSPALRGDSLPPSPALQGDSLPPSPALRGDSLPPSPALQGGSLPPCVPTLFRKCPTSSLPTKSNSAAVRFINWFFGI
jgi:hypothetical protein